MTTYQHSEYKEHSVFGRYVTHESLLKNWIPKLDSGKFKIIGNSVNGIPIGALTLGTGQNRVLMWSQMHGNESTTTKAVLDLVNFLSSEEQLAETILKSCTLCIVPILNPDGAKNYTRVNANAIDLNRDAKNLSQPESKILRELFQEFEPDFCFNLHDQRTLFSAGKNEKPATVSFLSPANDPERTINDTRATAMKLIVGMNKVLQQLIPGQVGRYDDGFNDNCVGDAFQMLGAPTILFEAGHFPKDYEREETRKFIYIALLEVLSVISNNLVGNFETNDYFEIPENEKLYFDVIVRNLHLVDPTRGEGDLAGIRFKEQLDGDTIVFLPEIEAVGKLEGHFGHQILDCSKKMDLEVISQMEMLHLLQNG
ncbi:M14 family metallopeptidase [Flagellimonas flava]|uniref:Zinc carboxypeptidase n=1 Tax=Flagellimonas flava TaxID=570519 RepID=A0A1M5IX38_9FLAO|nr:M14 metallopeptidase family protein [Allomuricauda flava]SHG32918.1 Zinc carboxypeptidase [Allomuricauda flava]